MDQGITWYGARPRPRRLCVRWGRRSTSPKWGRSPQIFGPCLLWPNGWMDEAGTWHGGLPPCQVPDFVKGTMLPSSKKGAEPPPQFSSHFYCGQTAGCVKMPLGMEVGLSPGDFGLNGDQAPYLNRCGAPTNFRPTSIVAKQLHGSRCHLVRR